MEFSRQEYRSGSPLPSQVNFPTQGSNLGLLHYRQILYSLGHQGNPLNKQLRLNEVVTVDPNPMWLMFLTTRDQDMDTGNTMWRWRWRERTHVCKPKRKASGETSLLTSQPMDFQLPELRENKSLLFIKPPGLWCLLQQPELIHIICRAVGEKKILHWSTTCNLIRAWPFLKNCNYQIFKKSQWQ